MELKERVKYLWKKYDTYKETAEQHEFFLLFTLDRRLIPMHEDLQANYTEEHAIIFVNAMEHVLDKLGVSYER